MANRTDVAARTVHGTNPQFLLEKLLRLRIYAAQYWKEKCFGLDAETLVDEAMQLDYIGSSYGGNRKATPFICLVLKMLQIQPDKEIVVEFIKNEDEKYVRALGAFYLRLIGTPVEVYQYLEPLYNDYRKLKKRSPDGWTIVRMDEFIDELIMESMSLDLQLPHLPDRLSLERTNQLKPRVSVLDDEATDSSSSSESEDDIDSDEDRRFRKFDSYAKPARYELLPVKMTDDRPHHRMSPRRSREDHSSSGHRDTHGLQERERDSFRSHLLNERRGPEGARPRRRSSRSRSRSRSHDHVDRERRRQQSDKDHDRQRQGERDGRGRDRERGSGGGERLRERERDRERRRSHERRRHDDSREAEPRNRR